MFVYGLSLGHCWLSCQYSAFILYCIVMKKKQYDKSKVKIELNEEEVVQVRHAKFLGVYIDERLAWDKHIQQVAHKMSRSVGILRKLKYTIPQSFLMLLYNSLIYPYLLYCSIIWGGNSIYKLNPILILQKKALRIIANADFRAHSSPLFTKYKLLKIGPR